MLKILNYININIYIIDKVVKRKINGGKSPGDRDIFIVRLSNNKFKLANGLKFVYSVNLIIKLSL